MRWIGFAEKQWSTAKEALTGLDKGIVLNQKVEWKFFKFFNCNFLVGFFRRTIPPFFVEQGNRISELMDYSFHLPSMMKDFVPFYELVIAQLFAYYSALYLNRNIDKPRNLAKSVTVQ